MLDLFFFWREFFNISSRVLEPIFNPHTHTSFIFLFTVSYCCKPTKLPSSPLSVFQWTGDDLKNLSQVSLSLFRNFLTGGVRSVCVPVRVGAGERRYVALAADAARVVFPPATQLTATTQIPEPKPRVGERREDRGVECVCVCVGGVDMQRMASNQPFSADWQSVNQSEEMFPC